MYQIERRRSIKQQGFTLIEVIAVLAIASAILLAVLSTRTRGQAASWVQAKNEAFSSVMNSMDICKVRHGNTYPAAATAGLITTGATTTAANAVASYVGSASTDINQWKYKCPTPGTTMTIEIIDEGTPSTDVQNQLIDAINNGGYGSATTAAIISATEVDATTTGTACQ